MKTYDITLHIEVDEKTYPEATYDRIYAAVNDAVHSALEDDKSKLDFEHTLNIGREMGLDV